jgi:urea transport system substrate-binding protein
MDGNHHLHKPVMIGEVRADGQFNIVWKTKAPIRAQPWSPYIAGNQGKPDVVSSIREFLRRRSVA